MSLAGRLIQVRPGVHDESTPYYDRPWAREADNRTVRPPLCMTRSLSDNR